MTPVEQMLVRLMLLCVYYSVCAYGIACAAWMVSLAGFRLVELTGGWLPATVAALAWSKWRRQCETEAELELSLPIARIV